MLNYCFWLWNNDYEERADLREREELLTERLRQNQRKRAFVQFLACSEELAYEKSLERRSNFFFAFYGARNFFKNSQLLLDVRREEKIKESMAYEHFATNQL